MENPNWRIRLTCPACGLDWTTYRPFRDHLVKTHGLPYREAVRLAGWQERGRRAMIRAMEAAEALLGQGFQHPATQAKAEGDDRKAFPYVLHSS